MKGYLNKKGHIILHIHALNTIYVHWLPECQDTPILPNLIHNE